jgi:single-stranded-DNA-specific exonuclease
MLLADSSWHPGVIGLVAGRLVERFRRPAFVLTVQNGVAKGSARSIPGFDLGQAIRATKKIIIGGGGHEMAAGFSVSVDRIPELAAALEEFAQQRLTPEDFRLKVPIDVEVAASEASPAVGPDMRLLEPFGNANPEPVFCCRGVRLSSVIPTSNPDHARVTLDTDDGPRSAMAFGIGRKLAEIGPETQLNVVFTADENVFNGKSSFRWVIQDVQSDSF